MNSILIESQYIGACSYWNILLKSSAITIDKEEHYTKRSYRNRAHILGANGLLRLSIPLERGKQQHSKMKDVRISYNERWQDLHWQSFTSAYRRSPFFEYYEDYFRKFYEGKYEFLLEYNTQFIQTIAKILKVELPISFSEQYFTKDTFEGDDYRNIILPNKVFANKDIETYLQVFNDRFPFEKDLCVLDALFNLGNGTKQYLESITFKD
jgi:hypothetical protein